MRRSTRFEKKIVLAMAAVALVPLVGALLFGRAALREAYQVGVNSRVEQELESALEIRRTFLLSMRDDAERAADSIVDHYELRHGLERAESSLVKSALERSLERHPEVVSIVLRNGDGVIAQATRDRKDQEGVRELRLRRRVGAGLEAAVADILIVTLEEPFLAYQRAGEVAEVYRRLRRSASYVSGSYLAVYIAFLVSVIVAALTLGVIFSRRVTGRIVDVARATRQVGAGDLSVAVPIRSNDEIAELTRAFNQMVADMRDSRSRIEYLQRIGGWQEFARRLAHEIKNPLTPIHLATQELLQSYREGDAGYRTKLVEACAIIEEEVSTLRRLVGEFSAFAKLPDAHLLPADLRDLISDLERTVPAILEDVHAEEDARITVRVDPGDSPLPVEVDAMMLKRCLDNLVRNALQAVAHGSARPTVVLAARREGEKAVIEVRDSGPGIPFSDRARVFDPYFTTKAEGTGLGLAIVKKVVLEHRGEIDCGEAAEGGAMFRITLPLDRTSHRRGAGSIGD